MSFGSLDLEHRLRYSRACGIFEDQGWNLHLLHWWADSLPLSHQGNKPQGENPVCSRCGNAQLTSLVLTFSVTFNGQQLPLESSLSGRWQVRSVRGKMLPRTTLNQNLELGVHSSLTSQVR